MPQPPPTPTERRRALARVARGDALDAREIAVLLQLRGDDLVALTHHARDVRDLGLADAGRSGTVTYSPKVFAPLTRLCRDRCHYCTFAATPGKLRSQGVEPFMGIDEVVALARQGAAAGCLEVLLTLGDRPEARWPTARQWLDEAGFDSTISYVRAAAIAVLESTGLLPHVNPGVMSWSELQLLRPVAPSMGMMLETTAVRLAREPGGPHFGSPDKDPDVRLRVLADAGRSSVPFTTGMLVGIGETFAERADTLVALRASAREFGHVQEVIVQNFRAKSDTAMRNTPDLDHEEYLAAVATSRVVMGPTVRIQVPPNLTDAGLLRQLLDCGIDDWGGVSPVTPDHVNPERPWPHLDLLREATESAGLELVPRLTVHPEYVRAGLRWIDPRLQRHVAALATSNGLADPAAVPVGRPWQEPDAYEVSTDAPGSVDSLGGGVHGNWDAVGARARRSGVARQAVPADVAQGLRLAEARPSDLSLERHRDLAVALMSSDGQALVHLAELADSVRRDRVGEGVTYVVNRNINFTNVCYAGCRFCAFAQRESDSAAETLSLGEIGERVDEAVELGATEICLQGGIHPRLPGSMYADIVRVVSARGVHVHAFSPMEVASAAHRAGVPVRAWLTELRDAGLGSIPGTAAEILDDDVRRVLTKGKLPTEAWLDVVRTAHTVGLRSSSTMMYGHVDAPSHWVDHLRTLRRLQEDTGGFTEFVGLPFVHHNAPIYLAGVARPGPSARDDIAVTAMARLMLDGAVDNIQVSWVKVGPDAAARLLQAGANDLGGTLMEENISRMAGSQYGSAQTVGELAAIAAAAGRPAHERTTLYERVAQGAVSAHGA